MSSSIITPAAILRATRRCSIINPAVAAAASSSTSSSQQQQCRSFAGGGFQGPTSRGMGREGGGRGPGGAHRTPRKGGESG